VARTIFSAMSRADRQDLATALLLSDGPIKPDRALDRRAKKLSRSVPNLHQAKAGFAAQSQDPQLQDLTTESLGLGPLRIPSQVDSSPSDQAHLLCAGASDPYDLAGAAQQGGQELEDDAREWDSFQTPAQQRAKAIEKLKREREELLRESQERMVFLELRRDRQKLARQLQWEHERAVHGAMHAVGRRAKQRAIQRIRQERERLRVERIELHQRACLEGKARIESLKEKKLLGFGLVRLPKRNVTADEFPEELCEYLKEELSFTGSRELIGARSPRKAVLGGGFRTKARGPEWELDAGPSASVEDLDMFV